MGDVAILRPQNILKHQMPETLIYSQMRSRKKNPNPSSARSNRSRRSPTGLQNNKIESRKGRSTILENFPAKNLVVGQVKIMKRGEDLDSPPTAETKNRLVPAPEIVPEQVGPTDLYAGFAFIASPPPSSVPLPTFSITKSAFTSNNNAATTDLLRILRLD